MENKRDDSDASAACPLDLRDVVPHGIDREVISPNTCALEDHFFREVNIEFLVHELKDPVSVIETGAHLLLDKQDAQAPLADRQKRILMRILRNAQKTREMLGELLEVGRAQAVCFHCRSFQPLRTIQQTLIEVIESCDPDLFEQMKTIGDLDERLAFLTQKGIRLDATSAAEGIAITQDETKFKYIVGNLIKNGFSYRRRHLLLNLSCQRECITVSVRDDGPGIAPYHHEAIFLRYKQVTPHVGLARSGHGLGLAIARILTRSMGGNLVVESELGQGALFHMNLPICFPD
jgi:signal transduction histidine kinase